MKHPQHADAGLCRPFRLGNFVPGHLAGARLSRFRPGYHNEGFQLLNGAGSGRAMLGGPALQCWDLRANFSKVPSGTKNECANRTNREQSPNRGFRRGLKNQEAWTAQA